MTKEEALQKLEFERKWLSDAGYNAYNVDIAFDSIRTIIKVLCGDEPILNKIRDDIEEYKSRQLSFAIGVKDLEEGKQVALEYVLNIIDEYKESEVEI